STLVSGTADFSFFSWARVFQTVALPFLFVPITSASYSGLPPDKTDAASSLINVARNLGGSLGISAATTMLARYSQVHQNYLVGNVVASSLQYQDAIKSTTNTLIAQGMSSAAAQQTALALLDQQVSQQATLLAYIDVFSTFGIIALLLAPTALILL